MYLIDLKHWWKESCDSLCELRRRLRVMVLQFYVNNDLWWDDGQNGHIRGGWKSLEALLVEELHFFKTSLGKNTWWLTVIQSLPITPFLWPLLLHYAVQIKLTSFAKYVLWDMHANVILSVSAYFSHFNFRLIFLTAEVHKLEFKFLSTQSCCQTGKN